MSTDNLVNEVQQLLAKADNVTYGEGVTMLEHSLQVAQLAHADGAPDTLVVAALLHDIGTFVSVSDGEYGEYRHDRSGGAWLAERFPAAVSEPVRLHVEAKRYLCAVERDYHATLSAASVHTLAHQGGPMDEAQQRSFEQQPFFHEALRLRRWDDAGKVPDMAVPALSSYRTLIASVALGNSRSAQGT